MLQLRQSVRSIAMSSALLAVVGAVPSLQAQGPLRIDAPARRLFEWKGRVDGEVRIVMRGREAWIDGPGGGDERWGRGRANDRGNGRGLGSRGLTVVRALPTEAGIVRTRLEQGGGRVDVVQQPSHRNDYTAIVRVRDNRGGKDKATYRVSAYWVDVNDPRDVGRGRDSDDEWGRRDRDDDAWGWERDRGVRTVLRWSGYVDDGLEIWIRDGRIIHRTTSGKGERDVRAELSPLGLRREAADLRAQTRSGRGDVVVVQQPSRRNDYTAVIRVRDPQPSYGFYDFTVVRASEFISQR